MTDQEKNKILVEFGNRFRRIRRAQDITLEDLSNKSGIAYSTIVKIEKGDINTGIANFIKLAEQLQVEPAEFFKDAKSFLD